GARGARPRTPRPQAISGRLPSRPDARADRSGAMATTTRAWRPTPVAGTTSARNRGRAGGDRRGVSSFGRIERGHEELVALGEIAPGIDLVIAHGQLVRDGDHHDRVGAELPPDQIVRVRLGEEILVDHLLRPTGLVRVLPSDRVPVPGD